MQKVFRFENAFTVPIDTSIALHFARVQMRNGHSRVYQLHPKLFHDKFMQQYLKNEPSKAYAEIIRYARGRSWCVAVLGVDVYGRGAVRARRWFHHPNDFEQALMLGNKWQRLFNKLPAVY